MASTSAAMRALLWFCLVGTALGRTADEWRSRSVYQVLTDRFALGSGGSDSCGGDLHAYCGGSFAGIESRLDYITRMGFNAIWISPVVAQTDRGYHGYWASDLTRVNPYFGDRSSLKSLVDAAHSRGVWVMLDVVANHMGPSISDIGGFNPFNQSDHYHDCGPCPSDCNIANFNDDNTLRHCRLSGLPDLNQENNYVASTLASVYRGLIDEFGFDGIRLDTTAELTNQFLASFQEALGAFVIGEVFNGDSDYVKAHGQGLDSVLSYPMFFTIKNVFGDQQGMSQLSQRTQEYQRVFGAKASSLLGTFVDNHDNPRFLSKYNDKPRFRAALAFSLLSDGIPIVYYGDEQDYTGGGDPNCREKLWPSNYNEGTDTYKFIRAVNAVRNSQNLWDQPVVERVTDQDKLFVFSRGNALIALTNVGASGPTISRTVSSHPYQQGAVVCNIFYPDKDCVTVKSEGVQITLVGGETKIFLPEKLAHALAANFTIAL